jgi:hypothetical protein
VIVNGPAATGVKVTSQVPLPPLPETCHEHVLGAPNVAVAGDEVNVTEPLGGCGAVASVNVAVQSVELSTSTEAGEQTTLVVVASRICSEVEPPLVMWSLSPS